MSNKAAVISAAKAQIKVEELPIPKPKAHEVLVKNHAVATNPVDYKIQRYGLFIKKYPTVLGSDVAGTVEAIGENVTSVKKGDRVAGFAAVICNNEIEQGAFQKYVILKDNIVTPLPSSTTFEEGALLPMAVATAGCAIFINMEIPRPPHKQQGAFLIWGGSSSVGSAGVQIAAQLGFTVYATASPRHHAYVKSLGAAHIFDYNDPQIVQNIVSAAKAAGQEIKLAYDAISENDTSPQTAAVVSAFGGGGGGKLVITLPWPESTPKPTDVAISNTGAFRIATDQQEFGKWLFTEWLPEALVKKTYVPSPGIERVEGGLESVQEAFDMHAKGLSGKKLVIPLGD